MNKKIMVIVFALCVFAQCANTTKLLITNNAQFTITTHPDFDWQTTDVNQGQQKVVFDNMDVILTSFSAFEKGSTSSTVTKYKLKVQLVNKFNSLQRDRTMLDKKLEVQFPEDFDKEVSLRASASRW